LATASQVRQQQLNKLKAELANLKKQQSLAEQQSKGGLLKKPNLKGTKGIDLLAKYTEATKLVNAKQAEYDALKKIIDETKTTAKVVSEVGSREEALKAAAAGLTVEELRAKSAADLKAIQDEKDAAARAAGAPANTGNISIEDFLKNLDSAGANTINEIKTYLGISKKDGKLDYQTIVAIYAKEKEIETVADATGKTVDRLTYYKTNKTTGTGAVPTATISSPTAASALINSVFQTELGRDANASEIQKYTLELNAAERKNPSKTVKGITSGGLNKTEFLTQIAKKLPEFTKKKTDKANLTTESILATARANGLNLGQDQLNSFTKQVQDGTDIKTIQSQIRNIAGLGMPENVKKLLASGTDLATVYAPYKSQMAAILELSPESINFTDPTLRGAIGPNGEMSIYDFQKALRKDARWQYTNNAREDVFQSVGKVLQDFGFQG
jgi:hypothetical protein